MTPATLSKLVDSTLDDIYLIGLLDQDETPAQFCPQLRQLYLELGGELLELRCVEDTGTLGVRTVAEFSEVPWNSDGLPTCTMSIRDLVLTDSDANNQVTDFRLFGASFDPSGLTCLAVQLQLENGQVLFLDPSYHFGIRIGGSELRAAWRENSPGSTSAGEWTSRSGG